MDRYSRAYGGRPSPSPSPCAGACGCASCRRRAFGDFVIRFGGYAAELEQARRGCVGRPLGAWPTGDFVLQFGAPPDCGAAYLPGLCPAGYTVTEPCGAKPWCSSENVKLWRASADAAHKKYVTAWNTLMQLENKRQQWTETERLTNIATAYEDNYQSLPVSHWYEVAGASDKVVAHAQNVQDAACLIDLLNQAIKRVGGDAAPYGPPAPYTPEPKPLLPGGAPLLAGAGALVAGLVVLLLLMRSGPARERNPRRPRPRRRRAPR